MSEVANFKIFLWSCVLLAVVFACDNLEYSPNQAFDHDSPRNLNSTNIRRLLKSVPDDTITFAFVGDSQRFYDEVDAFVDKVNGIPSVDFVLLAGDISDFGLLREFEWIHESFSRLNAPYMGVVGNHDVVGNGEKVFTTMFGPLDYSFVYDSVKFVIHNTNSREYIGENVPDLAWLENELKRESTGTFRWVVGVSHVPPTDADFNSRMVERYASLLASTPGFIASLHGHIHEHTDHYPFNDGVRYITSYAFNQNKFLILQIVDGTLIKKEYSY